MSIRKYNGEEVLLGADPECFGVDDAGVIVSMIGKVGGSKEFPLPVNKGAVQEDNILAEFNIIPANTAADFIGNIRTVIGELSKKMHPYSPKFISHATFNPEFFKLAGPKAMEFGCDPDYNAWTLEQNESPNASSNLRTAAGHVHVGFNRKEEIDSYKLAALMDLYIGVPTVLLDKDGAERREMYGKAGACRPKPYGVEYRVPSNFWLTDDAYIEWIFNSSLQALDNLENFSELYERYKEVVPNIINTSDEKAAMGLVLELGITLPKVA